MGRRVYMSDDGKVFESREELVEHENRLNLEGAFERVFGKVPETPNEITREAADDLIAALKPFSTPIQRPRRSVEAEKPAGKKKKGDPLDEEVAA